MFTKKIKAITRLFRPELSLAAGLCVTLGQVLALGKLPGLQTAILGFVCAFALSSAALILNDYFDYEVDRINAPDRPLPSGAVSRAEVIGLTALVTLVGLSAAALLGLGAFLVSVIFWWIGFLYNWRYKQAGLAGNLMVCASVAVTFILGAMTVQAPWNPVVWTFSLIVFFFDLGEEIAADAMDMQGDQKRGSQSIAIRRGKPFALRLCVALWGAVILVSLLPVFFGWLGGIYLVFILLTDSWLVYSALRLLRSSDDQVSRKVLRSAYLGATLGLVAFLIGQLL